ncbi:hypothetical protein DFJ58DRAFT_841087 [Suillus subalutaceus]|uniref:uncharacterized protein n=1 Tax=Suillus subalutaceus TaxID=48586 RepID=UPI001B8837EB|nr:uncharacterized protein DFJ58DRAFT_841087 [Suillus subalutaceus]KAG1855659.1 hypothetical protein DFJ58DRAFT_841087 [Suillus subalutaceus]
MAQSHYTSSQKLLTLQPFGQLGENQSLKKADKWRRLLTITPVLLWWSWKDENDDIPDAEPPQSPNMQAPEFSRNCQRIYDAVLLLCAAVHLFTTQSISMSQARIGQSFLSQYCLQLPRAQLHIADMIKAYGPVYSCWLFAFEHFNGMLERVNNNGHGRLTLMCHWNEIPGCGWLKWICLQTWDCTPAVTGLKPEGRGFDSRTNHQGVLVGITLYLSKKKNRNTLHEILKSQAQQRGSMMTDIAVYQSKAAQGEVHQSLNFWA